VDPVRARRRYAALACWALPALQVALLLATSFITLPTWHSYLAAASWSQAPAPGGGGGSSTITTRLQPLFDLIERVRPLGPTRQAVHAATGARGLPSSLAICAIVKDQQEDLLEWIEWHRCGGSVSALAAGLSAGHTAGRLRGDDGKC
jgi:hypothetical protein